MKCLVCNAEFEKNRICSTDTVCETCCAYTYDLCQINCKNKQIEVLLSRITELEDKLRWIPVSERLPGNGMKKYEVISNCCDKDIRIFNDGGFYRLYWNEEITHWREIPELEVP